MSNALVFSNLQVGSISNLVTTERQRDLHMRDMTHLHTGHDVFIYATWTIYIWDMSHLYPYTLQKNSYVQIVWETLLVSRDRHRDVRMRDVTDWGKGHDLFTCGTRLICIHKHFQRIREIV